MNLVAVQRLMYHAEQAGPFVHPLAVESMDP